MLRLPRPLPVGFAAALLTLAALAVPVALAALIHSLGAWMMQTTMRRACAALAVALAGAVMLSGCASLGNANGEATAALLANLRGCERSYIGTLGGLAPPAASLSIRCAPDVSGEELGAAARAAIQAEVARALGVSVADTAPAAEPR